MPKIVIPSRNRPTSISGVLNYLADFYPGSQVFIADGSDPAYKAGYAKAVANVTDRLDITYRLYGAKPTLAERMVDALQSFDDELIIVGADDDYPVLEVLLREEDFMMDNPDYILAIGAVISLRLFEKGELQAKLFNSRPITHNSPIERVKEFIKWPFATSYALVRRTHYIERCGRAELCGFPGFGDYTVGFHDCLAGKIKALDDICYFQTSNSSHSKIGRRSRLFYLERAEKVLETKDHYYDTLLRLPEMTEKRAEDIAIRMINTRIVEMVTPALQNTKGFGKSEFFQNEIVRKQYNDFQSLFQKGSVIRNQHLAQLTTIVASLKKVAAAQTDNLGEPDIYDSIEDMHAELLRKET